MIVVFGSINIDLTFFVEHLPIPGETVLCPSYLASPGGKGANQAVAAARAGAETVMIGCIGQDSFAEPAMATLRESGVDMTHVKATGSPTACATISVDASGENSIIVASGANLLATANQIPHTLFGSGTILLLQMEIPYSENWTALDAARRQGAKIALNVAPAASVPVDQLDKLDYLIVNEVEGAAIAQSSGQNFEKPEELVRLLAETHDLTCVLTLGTTGAILFGPEGGYQIPALAVDPVDTTGAGDTYVGIMAAGLDAGLSTVDAARRASVGAALACTNKGAQIGIPFGSEIDAALGGLGPDRQFD